MGAYIVNKALPRAALFLDRDGVINEDVGYLYRVEQFHFLPGVLETCKQMYEAGYALVVITNQSGIARGYYTETDFQQLTRWMTEQFNLAGAPLAAVYFCPHHPDFAAGEDGSCHCRKPAPGMLLQAAAELDLDLSRSLMVGDKEDDIRAGRAAGVGYCVRIAKDPATTQTDADLCVERLAALPLSALKAGLATPTS